MFETLTSILNQGLSFIVPIIVLLGLLIFIHELGHFLAAKYYGVKVEIFSLGFGPKIFQFVHSETIYCISALPLGGYVKMYGDDPGKEIPSDQRKKSFLHKPVGQRIVISLAGPLMNLFFASLLFYFIAHIGDKTFTPQVGEIAPNSNAYEKGFRPYDRIITIDREPIKTWRQVENKIESSPNKALNFHIERMGEKQKLLITPKSSPNDNLFSTANRIGKIHGLHSRVHLPVVGVLHDSPLYQSGLRTGDHILEIDGVTVKWFMDIKPTLLESLFSGGSGRVQMKLRRFKDFQNRKEYKELSVTLMAKNFKNQNIEFFVPETVIAEVQKDSPAFQAGLQKLDKITKINGQPIHSFDDIIRHVSSYKPKNSPLEIEIQRENNTLVFPIAPEMNHLQGKYGEKENRFTIGVIPLLFEIPKTFIWKSSSFTEATHRAFRETWLWTKITVLSFVRIFQNRVSPKNIRGVISISQVAQRTWNIGLSAFLKMMAIISINLFIINLLPIPILDGGHLLLFTLEAIKGAPLNLKKVEIAQKIGFLVVLLLMAFALFNDFTSVFGS